MPHRGSQKEEHMPVAAKASWTVQAGIIPAQPRPELSKSWWYTSLDAEADRQTIIAEEKLGLDPCRPDAPLTIFQQRKKEAVDYWDSLNDPRQHNWANIVFIWY
jgi:hypothetical protein